MSVVVIITGWFVNKLKCEIVLVLPVDSNGYNVDGVETASFVKNVLTVSVVCSVVVCAWIWTLRNSKIAD